MPHRYDPKDQFSYGAGHSIKEMLNIDKANADAINPSKPINPYQTFGASQTMNMDYSKMGSLGKFMEPAVNIMNQVYQDVGEPTQREKNINLGRMALNFFTNMSIASSQPGATLLSAGVQSGAKLAQDYLNKELKDESDKKKLDQAKKVGAVTLASQLKAADDAKTLAKAKVKSEVVPIYRIGEDKTKEKIKNVIKGSSEYVTLTTTGGYSTVKPDMGTIKEDEFGVQFYIGGIHDGKKVRDVLNAKKIQSNENVDTEREDDEGLIVSTEPKLIKLTKTQHSQAKDLRKSIMDQTKDYRDDIEPGFRKILQFFNDQDPIGDYALAVGFAKMIDPGSVAKEGEVRAVQKAGSLPEELKAQLINALTGQGALPPRVRAGIVNRAIDIYNSERAKVTAVIGKVAKSWASQVERTDQIGHIVHFDVGEEYDVSKKIDLNTLPEVSNKKFEFNEEAVKQLSIPQLTALFQQNLTEPQIQFVLDILKQKKAQGNR